tara:strand:+ start:22 stop:777 length:756 start_codon:yes stop_codon:yes gene_type:complete
MKHIFFITLLTTLTSVFTQQNDFILKETISKAENRLRGKSSIATMSITVVRPKYSREMKVKNWTKTEDYNVMYIIEPTRDKGTVYLKRNKEIWYYIPSIERNIKMPPSMMNQSWMGTDMSNDDLVKKTSYENDFSHRLIGSAIIAGVDCYEVELFPHEDADVVWGKVKMWIDKSLYNIMKQEQYDEDLELVNTTNASEVKSMGGEIVPTKMEIVPADKKGQKTVMKYESIEFDIDISEQYFTTQYMTRLRP